MGKHVHGRSSICHVTGGYDIGAQAFPPRRDQFGSGCTNFSAAWFDMAQLEMLRQWASPEMDYSDVFPHFPLLFKWPKRSKKIQKG